ncbi:zinc finger protein ubi-d4 isoform X1 [Leptinotarsa decemlineata]|uniref:zinc finger protein ubi-d4 isoform X1 n=1 Tax=Leptinotarsa decemlineata TaxID=7539 RepID=UPI000C251FD0|nr:zinc finger protein ubi-d4 A-like isoform X1 [Leptinotarsa decemlineata]
MIDNTRYAHKMAVIASPTVVLTPVDVVSPTVSTRTTLEKIESFLNDPAYKEALENSVNYNTRLCIERRLRLPFIDTQTGVAQNHSALFMNKRQRIPGLFPGQIYSYPRQRWRKKRRQYLTMNARAFARAADHLLDGSEVDMHNISQIENPALQDTDSKDSQLLLKDEVSKEWFYDETDMLEMEAYDEPDPDSDLDYEETYTKKKRGRRGTGRGRSGTDSPSTPGRKKGAGRGRKKSGLSFEPTPGDPDKPFACELCGARYKTRPGLTYHYRHSHKEGASDENSGDSNAPTPSAQMGGPISSAFPGLPQVGPNQGLPGGPPVPMGGMLGPMAPMPPNMGSGTGEGGGANPNRADQGQVYQDSYVSFLNQTPGTPRRSRQPNGAPGPNPQLPMPPMVSPSQSQAPPTLPPNLPPQQPQSLEEPQMPVLMPEKSLESLPAGPPLVGAPLDIPGPSVGMSEGVKKPSPSPYCDFCLGDSKVNKKTGIQEELVSCSDCGRSGHPSCLQFTDNMKISVKKYRWQCIECKCCSVCGNSDNDDQLLFCDDCDRGYHMYCLSPPLVDPPEGSWSCKLCIDLFHK